MGGSAGILAVAEGAPVRGLVSIAAPAELWGVWARHFDQKGLPGRWIVRVLSPFWRIRAGVPFQTLRPEERVRELVLPLLILHGAEDESVPVIHAQALARAAGTEAVVLEGGDHTGLLEHPDLHARVLTFLENVAGT
jgi:pimeloyl-ACP methyl ester carboxylesterase